MAERTRVYVSDVRFLLDEIERLREGIRQHRDGTDEPDVRDEALWDLLDDATAPASESNNGSLLAPGKQEGPDDV